MESMFEGWTLEKAKETLKEHKRQRCKNIGDMMYRQALSKYIEQKKKELDTDGTELMS